jgi:hypothetical protein
MAKGDLTTPPPVTVTPKQVVTNTKSASQKKGNLSLAPMKARGMGAAQAQAMDGKAKTVNSPPQNLQNPLTALFGDRMKSRRPK